MRKCNFKSPENNAIPSGASVNVSQAKMQRNNAADARQNESSRHYIDALITLEQFFNSDSTTTWNTAVCLTDTNEMKKASERERKSDDFT